MRASFAVVATLLAAGVWSSAGAQDRGVLTHHNDAARSGHFVVPALTWDKAKGMRLDAGFAPQVAGHLYAQPLVWRVPGSDTVMLLTASEDDVVQAFDARSGNELWRRAVGTPVPSNTLPCGNISPLGVTGTPVIDPASAAIYLNAMVQDANGPRHRIFGLALKDGAVLPGFPLDVADALGANGQSFTPKVQNQRSALTTVDGTLFVAYSGHFGDCGDYRGWVVGVPLNQPGKVVSWATRANGGGIWAPGGIAAVGRDLFVSTGNTMGTKTFGDGEAVVRLAPDLHRSEDKRDFFAPSNWLDLDNTDADLGGTGPVPLDVPGAGATQAFVLALGKDRKAYLLDRNNLGGIGGQLAVATVSQSQIITAPAVYPVGNGLFVAFQAPGANCPNGGHGAPTVLNIKAGTPPTMTTAWCGSASGRGAPAVTTTDGRANPIVWLPGAEGDNRLHGFKGDTGEELFKSDPLAGLRRFQTLIATPDRLYVGADGRVFAFIF
jgi:PQQ enzyme repeat